MPPPGVEAAALCRRSHWVPKSSRSACSNCRRGFKLFAGKHHCRLCGEVVCKACSGRRILFQTAAVRVCDDCVATNVQPVLARRQSLPDARFHGRASSRALLSTGRRSLPMDPELPTSASGLKHGSSSSDLPASARGRAASAGKRRARKDQQRADGLVLGEWRSIVHWNYSSSHVATAVFALCLAVLASLLAAAARK